MTAADHTSELESSSHENASYRNLQARLRYRHRTRDAGVEPFSITGADPPRHHAYHSSVQPRSSGYGFAPGSALDPEAFAMRNAQRSWPNRPLCDDGGYRIVPCDSSGGN